MTKLISKKQEIKNRIDLINKGEVPAGYKNSWGYVYPEEWDLSTLNSLCSKVQKKNKDNAQLQVLTNSATKGVILQEEYFDREIVNEDNTSGYYIVENGDFMYNPRISSNAPAGPINRNHLGISGIASPLYSIFRAKQTTNTNFIERYFESSFWHGYMKRVSNQGARHDRLNLTDDDFMNMPIPQPPEKEQEKIAEILCCCDKVIELKEKLLNEENNEKKYLMQILLKESSYSNSCKLGDLCDITTGKLDANAQVVNGKYRFYTCAAEYCYIDEYAFDTEALLISGNGANVGYIHYYKGKFNAYQRTYVLDNFKCNIHYIKYRLDYLLNQIISREKNAGNTPYIVLRTLQNINIYLPKNISKQTKIVNILSGKDKEIELLKQELDQYKQLKKSLSQLLLTGIVRVNEV